MAELHESFGDARVWRYWSTQSAWLQKLGDRSGWVSTFGITATEHHLPLA